ncbi:hypothetical protein [Lysobacter gummosus]|uniref:hypothetical protein n=1 Tax=Lysobacter gummosus TaxID=262324 RepID=UPI00362FBD5D
MAPGARPCAPPFGCPSVSRVTSGARPELKQRRSRILATATAKNAAAAYHYLTAPRAYSTSTN